VLKVDKSTDLEPGEKKEHQRGKESKSWRGEKIGASVKGKEGGKAELKTEGGGFLNLRLSPD